MAETLTCDIVTPVKTIHSSEASYVRLPGEVGSFGVMQGHEPLVSALEAGVVEVTTPAAGKGGKIAFVVSGGYAQISDNKVIVLANDALGVADVDTEAVRKELAEVESHIASTSEKDANAAYYKAQKAWLELQLQAVAK